MIFVIAILGFVVVLQLWYITAKLHWIVDNGMRISHQLEYLGAPCEIAADGRLVAKRRPNPEPQVTTVWENRQEFEEWFSGLEMRLPSDRRDEEEPLTWNEDMGGYRPPRAQAAWRGWQAARSKRSS